ncbi:TetR/AcrR family transcriptional regulator [Pseudarthrobacter sp. PS3-L1]|uniref:TetR/AcrR family transcriptional regulator n=1 Tax=Pseudarthrobacter sp. PS3-L1 TaxID=3046207 RepID=UPI0024BBB833|nr:TetR/AcrR family transcriptional regulator [Pseudarthrobacter sp. PS3-L1]MDJ0319691.1 TetR/AcrR family transcriptional regulator [Pseudarthrobacter sp. PS3-L1]
MTLPEDDLQPAPSRRELNKAATRQAISAAVLTAIRVQGPGNFTVEDIAQAAGISRRTFFNYFSSTEDALSAITIGFLDNVLQQFRLRPAGEPVLESAQAALMSLADPMTIAPLAELFGIVSEHPGLLRTELEAWDQCTEQIIQAVSERVATGHAQPLDDLHVRALGGSLMACGKAAMDVWFARCGKDFSRDSLSTLRGLLIESMHLLDTGFAVPERHATLP